MPVKQRVSRAVQRLRRAPRPGPGGHSDALTELLGAATRAPRKVYILADTNVRRPVREWIARFPVGTVHVVSDGEAPEWHLTERDARWHHAATAAQRNVQLKLHGSADVIIDVMSHDASAQVAAWRELFFHLRPRGVYVVDTAASADSGFTPAWAAALESMMGGRPADDADLSDDDQELSASVAGVAVTRDAVVVHKRLHHYAKLHDDEANLMLPGREPELIVTEMITLPPGAIRNRARTTSHVAGVEITALDTSLAHPALHLRHYRGRVSLATHSLAYTGDTVLPDSFRHHLAPGLDNPRMPRISNTFGRIRAADRPKQHLDGTYYYLDSSFPGRYQHLTTEVVSKLWGWDEAKRAIPDLKAYFQIPATRTVDPALEARFLTAYGIDEADIVWTDAPVTVDALVAATPMWHNQAPHYVHPRIVDIWQRLRASIVDPHGPAFERIFVSDAADSGAHRCRNAADVEDWFSRHGFEIVHLDRLQLADQAALFAAARVVAGFGGSALFGVLFAEQLQTMIVLNHEAYTARNEHLFASVLGADDHYFWSTPDIAHPTDGWSRDAFESAWDFDFERNAGELAALLERL